MKKYISVDDLNQEMKCSDFIDSKMSRVIKCGNLVALINKAEPMIAVSDIEELTDKWKELSFGTGLFSDLLGLTKPEPKKYGGLTIKEWEQLKKVKLIKVTLYFGAIAADSLLSNIQKISEITKLLPDPEGYSRYHDGGEQPIPDNVIVEVNRKGSKKRGKAIEFDWGFDFGYRIIGVAEDDKN